MATNEIKLMRSSRYGSIPPMEEENKDRNVIAALRYFTVGDPECSICEKRGTVVRVTTTLNSKILITMLCEKCSTKEIEGLLERGDMLSSPDGSHLISPMLAAATNDALAKIAGKMVKGAKEKLIKKKKKKKKKKKPEKSDK